MGGGWLLRGVGLVALVAFFAGAFTPLPVRLAALLRLPPEAGPAEAIVVLGADVLPDGSLTTHSLRRTIHALRLHRQGRAPLLVLLGVPARAGRPAESAARAELARELGIEPAAILTGSAWTTSEEAERAQALLAPRGIRRILLVTDGQHLARARRVFERAGFQVLVASADSGVGATDPESRLGLVRELLAEGLARWLYRVAGRT
jgi:uncharacterized SAM-binding protein YcdF (DUF218 family)